MTQKIFLNTLISILFLLPNFIEAQPAASKTTQFDLCYPDNSHPLNNALLTNLMTALPRKNEKACITFEANFTFKYQVKGANFRTEIFCHKTNIPHTIEFQRFDLSPELYPVTAQIKVKIDQQEKTFTHQLKPNTKIGEILTPDQPQKYEVQITAIKIGQNVLDRIVQKQQHISAYYTADTQIKLAFEDLQSINPDSLKMLDQYLNITRKNFDIVDRIKNKKLYKHLNLETHDPLNVYERTDQLYKATFEAKNKLLEQSNNLGEEYLRLGLQALKHNDTIAAIDYFDKAIDVNSELAGPHVEKAKIEFNRKNYINVVKQIRFISGETTHHSGNRKDMSEMIGFIENKLVQEAEKENKNDHYHEALRLLDSAEHICSSIQVVVCSDMINVARSHSWRGLLNQQIINWFDIISRKQYSELPAVVEDAFKFREQHNQWLTTNELLYTNLKIVQDTLVTIAKKLKNVNPDKSLEALYAIREICTNYHAVTCPEKLEETFHAAFQEAYQQMLSEAEKALKDSLPNKADSIQSKAMRYCRAQDIKPDNRHKKIIAGIASQRYIKLIHKLRKSKIVDKSIVSLLDSALTIRRNHGITSAKDENYHKTRLLKDYIDMLSEKAERMMQVNQIIIATELLREIEWVAEHFNYPLNKNQKAFIDSLHSKIGSKLCYQKSQQVEIYKRAAEKFKNRNDYLHAKSTLYKAVSKMKQNTECGFNITKTQKQIKSIETAAAYQKDLQEFKDSAVNNNFDAAIEKFDAIQNTYNDSVIQEFGLKYQTLDNWAKELDYLPFIHHAAKVLAERGNPNESFGLITLLYKAKYDHKLSIPAQKELGASLAKEFYIKDPSQESAQLYKGYIIEKKWSKPFKKAFQKQWKLMQTDSE